MRLASGRLHLRGLDWHGVGFHFLLDHGGDDGVFELWRHEVVAHDVQINEGGPFPIFVFQTACDLCAVVFDMSGLFDRLGEDLFSVQPLYKSVEVVVTNVGDGDLSGVFRPVKGGLEVVGL